MSEATTAFQAAQKRFQSTDKNYIPKITHPLGSGWRQPPTCGILVDDNHAIMDRATFDALPEYSGSFPSGVYEGKMWKRGEPYVEPRTKWMLCWFASAEEPDKCVVRFREILIV